MARGEGTVPGDGHDGGARRTAILHAVWELIATTGIDAVTMRRVASLAGVSVGLVQHHFGTRDDLVRASAAAMVDGAEERYIAACDDPAARVREAVAHVIPRTQEARLGTTVWLAYVAKSVSDPGMADVLAGAKRGQEDEVVRLLGGDRVGARRLIALADGLSTRVLLDDLSATEALALVEEEIRAVTQGSA